MRVRFAVFPVAIEAGLKFAGLFGVVEVGAAVVAILLVSMDDAGAVYDHEGFVMAGSFSGGGVEFNLAGDLLAKIKQAMAFFCSAGRILD